jgi:hypothetical protein
MLAASPAAAQLQPHRAEYSLRLGTALNATRIGRIVQDIAPDCDGWRIRRELSVEMSLTPTLKVGITSRMEGKEPRGGNGLTWRTTQVVNGSGREVRGTVQRKVEGYRVDLVMGDGSEQSILPPLTQMPVAAIDYLVRRLIAGSEAFPVLLLGAEADGAAFLVDVKKAADGTPEASPPAQRYVKVPGRQSWPFVAAIARPGQRDSKPILTLRGRIFDSGVMDGLVVDAGVVTVAAYLRNLEVREAPSCPK